MDRQVPNSPNIRDAGGVPRSHFAYRAEGERMILKNTPLGRAPQVKRENRDDDLDLAGATLFEEGAFTGTRRGKRQSSGGGGAADLPSSPESLGGATDAPAAAPAPKGAAVDIKFRPPRKACGAPASSARARLSFRDTRVRRPVGGKWTEEEDNRLREIVETFGAKNWKRLAMLLGNVRSDVQCLHRWNKVLRPGLSKGPWTADEDKIVKDMVLRHGAGNIKWSVIAAQLPGRIGKQCRERWFNHLDPEIKKGDWTPEEDNILFETQRVHGNRWSEIAKLLPGRTENAVKNRWNSSARKRWLRENGLTEASAAAGAAAKASSRRAGANKPAFARPPALSMEDGGMSSLMNSPMTELLDHELSGGLVGTVDPNDVFLPFDDDSAATTEHGDCRSPRGGGLDDDDDDLKIDFSPRAEFSPRVGDMDLGGGVLDLLATDSFAADTPTNGGLGARGSGATEGSEPAPRFFAKAEPGDRSATPASGSEASSPATAAGQAPTPAEEKLHRAAKEAVDRVLASSRNGQQTEVPLTMLPYFEFLNERGQRSIMNQLMAQFSQTSIAGGPPAPPPPPAAPQPSPVVPPRGAGAAPAPAAPASQPMLPHPLMPLGFPRPMIGGAPLFAPGVPMAVPPGAPLMPLMPGMPPQPHMAFAPPMGGPFVTAPMPPMMQHPPASSGPPPTSR